MRKLSCTALVLLTLLSIATQATAQQAQSAQQRRGPPPYGSTDRNSYQVWIDINALHDWMPSASRVVHFSPYPMQSRHTRLAGAWSAAAVPGLVLTLQPDGSFSLATAVDPDNRCSAGTERGNWRVIDETSELLLQIKTDTNGACGFSDLHAAMSIRLTDAGLSLITNEPAPGIHEIPLVRH